MKKVISLVIAVVMMASALCVSAFAAIDASDIVGNTTQDVYAKYVEGTKVDTYKVELSWGSMNFNYSDKSEQWDAGEHKWNTTTEAAWEEAEKGAGNITITNHSSKAVTAAFSFNATAEGVDSDKGFTKNSVTVKSAADSLQAESESVTFLPQGALTKTEENSAGYVKIGTITVTLD